MKFKTPLTLAATLAVGFSTAFAAQEETPLYKEMTALNKSLRLIKRQAADPAKKSEILQLVAKAKANVEASLKLQPKGIEKIPEAEKAAYLEKYKAQLGDLGKLIDALKANLEKGDQEAIRANFEKLTANKEKAHKDFGVEEE